jgi:hypothetical protein
LSLELKQEASQTKEFCPVEAVDFKFVNNSDETIFISKVSIEILSAQVDITPHLTVIYSIINGDISFQVANSGWGKALVSEVNLFNNILDKFEEINKPTKFTIKGGEKRSFLKYSFKKIKPGIKVEFIEFFKRRREFISNVYVSLQNRNSNILSDPNVNTLLSAHEKWHIEEFFERLVDDELDGRQKWHVDYFKDGLLDGIPINNQIELKLKCLDEDNNSSSIDLISETPYHNGGQLWWTLKGFAFSPNTVYYSLIPPKDIYAIHLSTELVGTKKIYNISHSIKRAEVDRFHLLFMSDKSAEYGLKLRFYYNNTGELVSEVFKIGLSVENNNSSFSKIKDGQRFVVVDGKLELAL